MAIVLTTVSDSKQAQDDLAKLRESVNNIQVTTKMTGCHGFCEQGPIVVIKPSNIFSL